MDNLQSFTSSVSQQKPANEPKNITVKPAQNSEVMQTSSEPPVHEIDPAQPSVPSSENIASQTPAPVEVTKLTLPQIPPQPGKPAIEQTSQASSDTLEAPPVASNQVAVEQQPQPISQPEMPPSPVSNQPSAKPALPSPASETTFSPPSIIQEDQESANPLTPTQPSAPTQTLDMGKIESDLGAATDDTVAGEVQKTINQANQGIYN